LVILVPTVLRDNARIKVNAVDPVAEVATTAVAVLADVAVADAVGHRIWPIRDSHSFGRRLTIRRRAG
jgi:hypothetical protein